jgi:ABC-2 type transport system ATP-binding protein
MRMGTQDYVIEAYDLTRRFGSVEAVKGLTFQVSPGSVFGLLGKNGCGKTTTIRMLLGLLRPKSGESYVLGEPSQRLSVDCRQRIGYLSEEPFPYGDLPVPALFRFVSAFFPRWDWDYSNELARRFEVPMDRPLQTMSAGERRKCELMLVLAQRPDLLILDDPALGLDVTVRREFLWAALEVARSEGKAVLFTSHVLTDVERVVDTVGVMDGGRLLVQARLQDLQQRTKRLVFRLPDDRYIEPPAVRGELLRECRGHEVLVVTADYSPDLGAALRQSGGLTAVEDLNLEDIFVALLEYRKDVAAEEEAP